MEALACLGIVVVVALALSICPFLVMLLWNWLMPTLFGLPLIGFWQAVGLTILGGLLTGGIKITRKG